MPNRIVPLIPREDEPRLAASLLQRRGLASERPLSRDTFRLTRLCCLCRVDTTRTWMDRGRVRVIMCVDVEGAAEAYFSLSIYLPFLGHVEPLPIYFPSVSSNPLNLLSNMFF